MLFARAQSVEDRIIVVNRYKIRSKYVDITRGKSVLCNPSALHTRTRQQALDDFSLHLSAELKDKRSPIRKEMERILALLLDGETVRLGCVCKPKACHGDIIRQRLLREYYRRTK